MQHVPATQSVARIEFTNHLMFNAVLTENEDLCIRLIEAILEASVQSVRYLDDESTIQPTLDARGARLDLLALVDGEYVDIEMQMGIEPWIERRCRFYHSAIATRYTPKGASYESVPRSYVVFICLSDPLGSGLARYELSTRCRNSPSIPVDDGATSILLNAQAWQEERNPEVSGMLHYVLTGSFDGGLAEDIAYAVEQKNLDRAWVKANMGIMTYEHELTALNNELDRKRAAVAAAKAEVEAAQAQVDAARAEAEAAQAQVDAARAEADAAQAQAQSARAEADAAQAQVQSARAEVTNARAQKQEALAIQELSRRLYAEGRVDEYFSALDDSGLMRTLLREFGLAE